MTGSWRHLLNPARAGMASTFQLVAEQAVGLVGGALTTPFFVGCVVLLYYDRRVRSEAYDLEVAAAGLAPA